MSLDTQHASTTSANIMQINADFTSRALVLPQDHQWVDSPMAGVERMMLDRIGNEVARATTLVRYAPNSTFHAHQHSGGEEILVLSGTFADEHGEYPAGTYLRNPIGTEHTPRIGADGATILVKLHQFSDADKHHFTLDTTQTHLWRPGLVSGLKVLPLHDFQNETHREQVALVEWAPHTQFQSHTHVGGEEIFVLRGTFYDEHGEYPEGTWIRSPHMSHHQPFTKDEGACIYVKTGHLSQP